MTNHLRTISFVSALMCTLFMSCSSNDDVTDKWWELPIELDIEWVVNDLELASFFADEATGLGESTMQEASGLAPSMTNPGYLWSHNDKGNQNLLFLLSANTGQTIVRYRLNGINNRDWEDIEIGKHDNGEYFIYLAETGDNNRVYTEYKVFKFKEPVYNPQDSGRIVDLDPELLETIVFNYPEGRKHDVETLMYDPEYDDLYLVTKRSFNSIIYAIPSRDTFEEKVEAIYVGEFPFTRAVGGNVSVEGDQIVVKTYDRIFYWPRIENEPLWKSFAQTPVLVPYIPGEPQGEAICFDKDGRNLYTLSEFSNSIIPVLYLYSRTN